MHHALDGQILLTTTNFWLQPISETDHHWRREMGCLRQHSAAEVVVRSGQVFTNGGKTLFLHPQKGQTIDSKKYCAQLDKLHKVVQEKRPELSNRKGVIFHHDNARPRTALITKKELQSFGWEMMQHPPYSFCTV
ncbi:histone-lysine N-methyltransferase SETMAR-like [Pseudomyrmex gracilis]|uniref:histone-lysine N-methyltransferase SETMAR-like n=1 Tax=Pseudomyrmex gracilis TaxID=219809 RepID=UPI00099582C4|nr:histone-lysine N-methyltransferase SETMAR-like [Pseudomyrmex gracilis]